MLGGNDNAANDSNWYTRYSRHEDDNGEEELSGQLICGVVEFDS